MKVSSNWPLAHEFACHATSCAPPPGGRGGSRSGPVGGPRAHMHMTDSQLARSSRPEHKRELERRKKENKSVFLSARLAEFACHAASCAPPPAGTGGSSGGGFLSADGAAAARKTLGVRTREDVRRKRKGDLERRRLRDLNAPGRGGSLPGTHGGDHKVAYLAMKHREEYQSKLALVNRARANHGMPPLEY